MNASDGLLAIDVGSSRVKLGWFPPDGACTSAPASTSLPIASTPLPQPTETLAVSHANQATMWAEIGSWLQEFCPSGPPGFLASVHPATSAVIQEIFANRLHALAAKDLPISIRVEHPDRVGIDRLLNAVAVNRIRAINQPAIVVDLGTACTVDLVASDGAFEGGAILPGVTLAATALHAGTASLPELGLGDFNDQPSAVGKSTQEAITSGLYWGMIGAVRELVTRIGRDCPQQPQLFLTGGGAASLAEHLASDVSPARHVPNLVLSGIAAVAEEMP